MVNRLAVFGVAASACALPLFMLGCDQEVSRTSSSRVDSDGSSTSEEKVVSESQDGTLTKDEVSETVDRDGTVTVQETTTVESPDGTVIEKESTKSTDPGAP